MNKEITPSEEYIKAISGKFDLDIVFFLDLRNKNISKLGSIPQCTSLTLLNLSKNKLTQISSLSSLTSLTFLDLSFNSITSIDPLESLIQLRHLELHGNSISSITPSKLEKLVRLDKLTFQLMPLKDSKDSASNPLCSDPTYRASILKLLPKLRYLDGISRETEVVELGEDEDNAAEIEKALNVNNFNFDFVNRVPINTEDVFSQSAISATKKDIADKYNEFENALAELKASLNEIK